MRARLINSQIVIYGSWFDPSIVTRDWVIAHGIAADADIHESSVFEPGVVKLVTSDFEMLMMAPQIQFMSHAQGLDHEIYVREIAQTVVNSLPADTPMESVSLNLNWHVWPETRDVYEVSRQLFYVPWNPTHKKFDTPQTLFGSYLSTEMLGGRMKLGVHPVATATENSGAEKTQLRLSFAFNFETQLTPGNSWSELNQHLSRWEDVKTTTKELIRDVVALRPSRGLNGLKMRRQRREGDMSDSGAITIRATGN